MKVLLVGCGSIGQRHLKNLTALSCVEHIFIYSRVKSHLSGIDDSNKVSVVRSIENVQADMAVIANETYRHVETALILARKGIHLFIEKPLSHTISNNLKILKKIINQNNLVLGIGYNLRFLGAIKFIKDILMHGAIGDIYFVKIEAGQYLPYWRKGRDYKISYSASKRRGGGVALDLSHEIDYMRYFFGDPLYSRVVKGKVSDLVIDSDDIFEGIYKYNGFVCNIHLDYLQRNKKRLIRIEASKGTLICDLISKEIVLEVNGKKKIYRNSNLFDLDKTYVQELVNFINAVKKNDRPEVVFEDGVGALKLIEDKNV